MAADVRDAGEVGRGGGRIVEEAQRDPARHEMALDPGVLLGRLGRLRHRLIGRAVIADIEQLARHDPPLDPPLLRIMDLGELARRGQQHLGGLGGLVGAAQKLHLREDVARVVAGVGRHGVELLLAIGGFLVVAGLAVERDARLRDGDLGAAQPARRPQRGLVVIGEQPLLHARLVIDDAQEFAIAVEHRLLDVGGQLIVAPGLAQLRGAAVAVALGEERARQHQPSHARLRRRVLEEAHGLRRLDVLHPQHRLGAAAEHAEARPIRIGGDEGEVARARGAVAVAAQDDPFDELARRRVGDGGLDVGRLAGAPQAQALDGGVVHRRRGLRGLRLTPRRQRGQRHRFVGDRFLVLAVLAVLGLGRQLLAGLAGGLPGLAGDLGGLGGRALVGMGGRALGGLGGRAFGAAARCRGLRHERRHEQARTSERSNQR